MTDTLENEPPKSRGDILKLKATGKRQEFPYKGIPGLKVVVSAKGAVGFASRFRRPDGKQGILSFGPLDRTNRKPVQAPVIGQPLTPEEAIILAGRTNAERKNGIDVVARRHVEKQFSGRQDTFAAQVMVFIEHDRTHHRRWRETAAALGYRFPWRGEEGDPVLLKDGLCDRWSNRTIADITDDDLATVIQEAQDHAVPGWRSRIKDKKSAPSRGRRLAAALGSLYYWLKKRNRIKINTMKGVGRPDQLKPRERFLNTNINVRGADELRWFWQATTEMGLPYGYLCQLLLLTGCRRKEISDMRWSEIADDFSMLHLPGGRTKNSRPNDVPLSRQAQDILKKVPKISDEFVFVNSRDVNAHRKKSMGNFSLLKSQLDLKMLTIAVKDRGEPVTIPNWQLHDLRRTVSTGMNAMKILPHVVESLLNHVSTGAQAGVAGTYNLYDYADEKRDAVDRWGAHIERIVSGTDLRNVVPMMRR